MNLKLSQVFKFFNNSLLVSEFLARWRTLTLYARSNYKRGNICINFFKKNKKMLRFHHAYNLGAHPWLERSLEEKELWSSSDIHSNFNRCSQEKD